MTQPIDRRRFLQTGSLALAATAAVPQLVPHAAEKPNPKPRLKKGIMYETVSVQGSVMEKLKMIKEAGFDGVEAMSHMKQEEVLRARDATGLEIPSVCGSLHWSKPLSDPDPAVRQAGVEALKQTLRDAKAYGASSVLLVPAVVNKRVTYREAYERSQAEIRKAIPLAEQLGVKIAIENVWNHFLLSPLEAARYVDEFKSPAVGWHFDVGNIIVFGWPEQWIRTLGKRIQKLHIKEFSRAKANQEGMGKGFGVEFLKGDNDWPAVMAALHDIGHQGWGIAEQGGADSLEGMRELSTAMDKIFAS